MLYKDITDHDDTCAHRTYSCPFPSCELSGRLEQVCKHLIDKHESATTDGEESLLLYQDISGYFHYLNIMRCYEHIFLVRLVKTDMIPGNQQFMAFVQLIGSRKEALKFVYRLELNGHRSRLTFEGITRSVREDLQSAFYSKECLVFGEQFVDNGKLTIKVRISRV